MQCIKRLYDFLIENSVCYLLDLGIELDMPCWCTHHFMVISIIPYYIIFCFIGIDDDILIFDSFPNILLYDSSTIMIAL